MRRLHDSSGNSHRGAVAPFFHHGPHVVITPCIYVVSTCCHRFRCVSTMSIQCTQGASPSFAARLYKPVTQSCIFSFCCWRGCRLHRDPEIFGLAAYLSADQESL